MKDNHIKFLDKNVVKPFLSICAPFFKKQRKFDFLNINDYQNFLIIRPGGIGDAALLLPLIKFLKSRGKNIKILCMRRNKGVFEVFLKQNLIDEIFLLDSIKSIFKCKNRKYDCIIDTEQSFSSTVLIAKFISAKKIIGFVNDLHLVYYDNFVVYYQEKYESQIFLDILKVFGICEELNKEGLKISKIESGLKVPNGFNLALFFGASIPWRKPPKAFFEKIISELNLKFDHIFIIGGRQESAEAESFFKLSSNVVNFCGVSISDTLRILQNSSVLISTDSGPLHLGVLSGVPNIFAIFGPGVYQKWAHPDFITVIKRDLPWNPISYNTFSQFVWHPFIEEHFKNLDPYLIIDKIKKYDLR